MYWNWGFIRQAKLNLIRFLRLKGTTEEVARGTALGIFIGMTPTMGFQMPIALFCALILRMNKLAAVLGVWITNPLTAPFIYGLEYETGRRILGMERVHIPEELSWVGLKEFGWDVALPLGVGSLVYAVVCTIIAYYLSLWLIPRFKDFRMKRWPRLHFRRSGSLDKRPPRDP